MIWFPLLLDFSFFGNPPLYFLYGRGIAYYECINTWIIFEWTYDLLLVISSWAWLYSIKADRTTQLHFYKTADDFTTTANLKAHTLNRWQTCYLNWKFNTFSILDIDFKFFFKMKLILALQDWNNLVYVCIVQHTCTKHSFERQELFVYQRFFVGIILLKKLRKSTNS